MIKSCFNFIISMNCVLLNMRFMNKLYDRVKIQQDEFRRIMYVCCSNCVSQEADKIKL